jgi:dTMP kinase
MSAPVAVAPGTGLGVLLRHDGFRSLAAGQLVSGIGDWMVTLALMVLVLEVSGSSTAVGGVLVLRLLPTLIAGPVVARLVRRSTPCGGSTSGRSCSSWRG